ncbi:MAG: hypothetical protein ACI4JC_04480 [Faecalibacterium sp.]
MLKQLIKYELKATSRIFAGLYLALMAVVVLLGVSKRLEIGGNTMPLVLLLVYVALCVAIAVMTLLQIIERFAKNLMGREGYLMHTLPVNESQLILSKLLTSVLWAVCGVLVGLLSMAVLFGILCAQAEVFAEMSELFAQLRAMQEQVNIIGELVQGVAAAALCFVAWGSCLVLQIYAACMLGHQFKKYPLPAGILAFFLLAMAENLLTNLLNAAVTGVCTAVGGGTATTLRALLSTGELDAFAVLWLWVLGTVALNAAFGAAYFFLTSWLMKHKLDL